MTSSSKRTLPLSILLIAVTTSFLIGGASRPDVQSLLFLRPLSAVLLVAAVAFCGRAAFARAPAAVIIGALAIALPLVQLLPLPPSVWVHIPGRSTVVAVFNQAGIALPWLPISLSPGGTWNAFFFMFLPLATLLAALACSSTDLRQALRLAIILGLVSGLLGLLQSVGPHGGPLYFYRITNENAAVGLFANRNHQALFLAAMLPMLAAYVATLTTQGYKIVFRQRMALIATLLLVPLILVTGSRLGLMLGVLGLIMSFWVYCPPHAVGRKLRELQRQPSHIAMMIGAFSVFVGAIALSSRASSITRLLSSDTTSEMRLTAFPVIWRASLDVFPFGSGLGSFDEMFRMREPFEALDPTYLNHAHNDWLELMLTAGLPGILLCATAVALIARAGLTLFTFGKKSQHNAMEATLGRLGITLVLMFLIGSATDYPLRVPSLAVVFALAIAMIETGFRSVRLGDIGAEPVSSRIDEHRRRNEESIT